MTSHHDEAHEEQLNEMIRLFYKAFSLFSAGPEGVQEAQRIQRAHHRILFSVARQPGISVNELLVRLQVSKQALHAPFRQLLTMGYLTSETAAHDRRVRQLFLTEAGLELERQLTGQQRAIMERVFGSFERKDRDIWMDIMKKFVETGGDTDGVIV